MNATTVETLDAPAFAAACARLLAEVEQSFRPSLLVAIPTGGLYIARDMAAAAGRPLPMVPVTCRRPGTAAKSRVPLLKRAMAAMPRGLLDRLRVIEHRHATRSRLQRSPDSLLLDPAELEACAAAIAADGAQAAVLVVDDAVDSGLTLAAVLAAVRRVAGPAVPVRSAVITVSTATPLVRPDFTLFEGALCRFPWSFDA